MENTWFYFFSTLMQTAASLIALFSIFVVFKIDKINDKINSTRELIIKVFVGIKNNENTPGADKKKNKEFCDKYNINRDCNTFEKYNDKKILLIFQECWNNRRQFLGFHTQFGNDLITEESIKLFSTILKNKNIIIDRLIINLICSSSLIVLASIFLTIPSSLRLVDYVYLMVLYTIIVTTYNAYSIFSIIKK
ncbi:MAG: hypothetical protein ABIA02_00880 [Candidatus Falkowbacteria bacterium]